jgi:hypothetical protein
METDAHQLEILGFELVVVSGWDSMYVWLDRQKSEPGIHYFLSTQWSFFFSSLLEEPWICQGKQYSAKKFRFPTSLASWVTISFLASETPAKLCQEHVEELCFLAWCHSTSLSTVFFFLVLGIKPRTSSMLGKTSLYLLSHPPSPFVCIVSEIGLFAQSGLELAIFLLLLPE